MVMHIVARGSRRPNFEGHGSPSHCSAPWLSYSVPENVSNLERFRFCAVNNVHFSEVFFVNVDRIILIQTMLHSLKYKQ